MRQRLLPLSLAGALCAMAVMAATTPAPPSAPPAEAKSGEANAPGAPPTVIAEQPRHETISKVMTSLVERSHYSRVKVDDSVSSKMLDSYIEALDGNRLYFLADDIAGFERYRFTLDDAVRSGHVQPAFDIFQLYRKRVEERIAYALSQLTTEPDFTVDEQFAFDREKQPWAVTTKELDWERSKARFGASGLAVGSPALLGLRLEPGV